MVDMKGNPQWQGYLDGKWVDLENVRLVTDFLGDTIKYTVRLVWEGDDDGHETSGDSGHTRPPTAEDTGNGEGGAAVRVG